MQPDPAVMPESSGIDPYDEVDDLREAATASPLADPRAVGPAPNRRQRIDRPPPLPSVYPGTNTPVAPVPAEPQSAPVASEPNGASAGEHPLVRELLLTPGHWHTWPAVAVLRWMLRQTDSADTHRLVYRSKPSLDFPPGEVDEVELTGSGVVGLTLRAPGIAAPGSPLPTSDILRIIQDMRRGGALAPVAGRIRRSLHAGGGDGAGAEQRRIRLGHRRGDPDLACGQQSGRTVCAPRLR